MRLRRHRPASVWLAIGALSALGGAACLDAFTFVNDGPPSGGGGQGATGGSTVTTGGGAGGAPVTSTTSSTGGTGGTGGSTGAGGQGDLVDRELVVRYFLDEAVSEPLAVDATGNLDLVHEGSDYFYVDEGVNRALRWLATGQDGGPLAEVGGTSVSTALSGAQRVTVELVLRAGGFVTSAGGSTIFGINTGSSSQETLEIWGRQGNMRAYWNDTQGPSWSRTPFMSRSVLHVVFDTGAANEDDRVKVYVNGAAVTTQGTLNDTSALPSPLTGRLRIGDDFNGSNSMNGDIFYAALYAAALTAQEVAFNYDRLSTSDDTQPASGN